MVLYLPIFLVKYNQLCHTSSMSGKKTKIRSINALVEDLRRPDLSVLGSAIASLPPSQWQPHMLFTGVPDDDLRSLTGSFPATLRRDSTTHPIFVIETLTSGHRVCPCSSKGGLNRQRYIRKGCQLAIKDTVIDRNSFLVESCSFTVPLDRRFSRRLIFRGVVPENCLVTPGGLS